MTAFSTRCCKNVSGALILVWLCFAGLAHAGDPAIYVRSAEVTPNGDALVLDATFQIDLGGTLEEAITKGVPLHFVTEFELQYERWYLLGLWNKTVGEYTQRYRISYNALTRQYRVTSGNAQANTDTLSEALAMMSVVKSKAVASRDDVDVGTAYAAQLRLRLDTSQLPKPFQINAIGSKGWRLSSDWHRWTVTP